MGESQMWVDLRKIVSDVGWTKLLNSLWGARKPSCPRCGVVGKFLYQMWGRHLYLFTPHFVVRPAQNIPRCGMTGEKYSQMWGGRALIRASGAREVACGLVRRCDPRCGRSRPTSENNCCETPHI